MPAKYYIGCSGYYYPYWRNRFYPPKLAPKNWLQHYSTVFNTVEMNGTFYRQPKPADLKKYYENTPADFKFSVKMSRYISHVMKVKEAVQTIATFQDLILNGLEDKLANFLFQMPPTFQFTEENLEQLLTNIPHAPHNIIELRHESWWNNEVIKEFKKTKLTFCNVDFPGKTTPILQSGKRFYLRMHGNPILFKSSYSEETLKQYSEQFPPKCEDYFVYFNNTTLDAGYTNALTMIELLKSRS